MEDMYIPRRLVIVAFICYYGGIVITLGGLLLSMQFSISPAILRILFAVPGLGLLIYSVSIVSQKCKCPHCDYNDWQKRNRGITQKLLSFQTLRKHKITCPQCSATIDVL